MQDEIALNGQPADADEFLLPLPVPAGEPARSMRFRRIPAGAFRMGARGGELNEEPVHRVEVPYEFWLGKFGVSQAEYAAVVRGLGLEGQTRVDGKLWKAEPSYFRGRPEHPVDQVSWHDAALWCHALTAELKARSIADICRLPTEVEWEYACRAGTETEYWCGDDESGLQKVAWFRPTYDRGGTYPVDSVPAADPQPGHGLGLVGVHGNVNEWCHDARAFVQYPRLVGGAVARHPNVATDAIEAEVALDYLRSIRGGSLSSTLNSSIPTVALDSLRVIRGGAISSTAGQCRSAYRFAFLTDLCLDLRGFRVCLIRASADNQGEGGAAARAKYRGGCVVRELSRIKGKALLDFAAGRSPVAGLANAAITDVPFAVIGKLGTPQPCGHETFDFSRFTSLTHLCLWGLDDLEEIEGLPESLERLDLRECKKLRSIPGVKLPRLETLDLGGCVGLPGLPKGLEAPALRWFHLDGCTGIEDGQKTTHAVNTLLQAATSLEELTLVNCGWLRSLLLPDQSKNPCVASVGDPRFPERQLKKLVLRGCTELKELPDLDGYPWLHHLDLRGCSKLEEMPRFHVDEADGRPTGLRTLYATGCKEMRKFCGLDIRRVHRGESTASIGESAAAGEKVNVAEQFRTLSTLAADSAELRMAKVLFLGSGRCGKTTVSKALRWSRYSDEERVRLAETEANPCPLGGQRSTANIRLDTLGMTWKAPGASTPVETDVHLWDFGGQEIYHNTHRLFASEGAVFVIVTTSPEEWKRRVDDDIEHGHTLGLTEEQFRRENTYRELAYWLDYVWEARGLRDRSLEMSDPQRAARVLIVFTGPKPVGWESVKEFLRKQAGRYEALIGHGIAVEEADICESFKLGRNPIGEIDRWISEHAAGVSDELGVRVPKLYKALADDCTKVARGELRAATHSRAALGKKLDGQGWLELVRSHDETTRTDRERGEIARGAARYLHECGRLFFLERLRENTLILDQKVGVELVYRVTSPSAQARRRAIHDVTRQDFRREKLWSVLRDDEALAPHEEFLFQLLDDCNLILSLRNDSYLAIHPELLDDLDRETDQALFKQWEEARPGQHQGPLVNHSFVIHDTGKGLLLGRNAFQRIMANVGRTTPRDMVDQYFVTKAGECEKRSIRLTREDSFKYRHEISVWKDGFQLHLLCEPMPKDATNEWFEPSSIRTELSDVLILRMEWRNVTADSGFRGGIFVQMLCADEKVKGERLREFLFGAPGETVAKPGRATPSGRHPAPLREYRLDGERPDLIIDDLRPEGLAPDIARALRGVGQPGWLRAEGPKSMVRYDVAISYRRKSSEAFVKALHLALEARGLHCYFDQLQLTGDRHRADQNTLVQIYERLRSARVLIVVPSAAYFAPPTSSLTGADNIFCPVELAEAVLAGSADVPPRSAGQFFWVRPEDEVGFLGWWDRLMARWLPWCATRGHVAVDQLQGQINRLLDRTSRGVIEPRIDRNRSGAAFDRENESISDARKNRQRLDAWSASVTHGTDQYLIAPRQPDGSGPRWDFSAIVERIDASLRRS